MSKNPVVVAPSSSHTATLIFLHGLGDTGHGWSSNLAAFKPAHVKLVCPTATSIPVTLNGGMRMPSWFDLRSLDPSVPEDEEGIKKAAQTIQALIEHEVSIGIPTERIVLGGFSQGGALALYVGLTGSVKLGGILALSSWLPLNQQINYKEINKVPVLQCHGESDPLVRYAVGVMSSQLLKTNLSSHEFKSYSGLGHSSCSEEMEDIKRFLAKVLP